MKYRIVKRARGWVVQRKTSNPLSEEIGWGIIATYRWHILAALHLLCLRERGR